MAPVGAAAEVVERLHDERGRRVVFVSHCLLNENVRFLGGASRSGAVDEVIEPYLRDGVGIVQLPCPEQRAWGGVLKRRMLACYGSRLLRVRPIRRAFVTAARWMTMVEYRGLARRTAREIADHLDSGLEVVEVVGVGRSPSCGVATTLDLGTAVAAMAAIDRAELTPAVVRRRVVGASAVEGEGLFTGRLRQELARRGVTVTFREHDLRAELEGVGAS